MQCQHSIQDKQGATLRCVETGTEQVATPFPHAGIRYDYYCLRHVDIHVSENEDSYRVDR